MGHLDTGADSEDVSVDNVAGIEVGSAIFAAPIESAVAGN